MSVNTIKLDDSDMVTFRAIVVELRKLNALLSELVQNVGQFVAAQTIVEEE